MISSLASIARANAKGVHVLVNALDGGLLSVTVVPQGDFTGDKETLSKPLQITGTVEELEAGIANAITSYQSARQSLEEQLADTLALLEAAKKEAADKGKKALTKSAKPDKSAKTPTQTPAATGEENDDEETGDEDSSSDAVSGQTPAAVTPPPVQKPAKTDAFELSLD